MGGKNYSFIRITGKAERKTMSDKGKNLIKNNKGKKLYMETAPRGIRQVDVLYRQKRFQEKMLLEQQNRIDRIKQARINNPVSLECPYCGGVREIYRFTGVIRCPFCNSVEMLPEVHKFIPEVDDPKRRPQELPKIKMPKQMPNMAPQQNKDPEKLALFSELFGFISLLLAAESCEVAIVGLGLGIVAQVKITKNPIGRVGLMNGWIGIGLNLLSIVIYLLIQ